MTKLTKYIIALTNLYGILHKDRLLEIYNSQNDEKITMEDVETYFQNPPYVLADNFTEIYKDCFVKESIIENDGIDELMAEKENKPYYIPEQEELLKYVDEFYFEKTPAYNILYDYIKENFYEGDDYKTQLLMEELQGICQFVFDMKLIFDCINNRGIIFESHEQAKEVLQLVMNLSNNVRLWENNGHTPDEMHKRYEKSNLRPLPEKPFGFTEPNVIDFIPSKKIGRNDPCPCGSGKKYKNCCLKKDENQ
jgi:preprotein translocase subunit SecA